mmetsp:Transcript_76197/g.126961  ORF Transcript_76197/g.126961 Transcript_76197/m.126961 type:complete len:284 (-) Transcript_76197:128-979(-)|eukprot:CAMPEP_0119346538 /NCGR_PEP_ID=MMETSP1333-20130426/108053_1 /TAXON_ID=418940 /ORGANISM="Scyphosphaera apsteinii, Strain RCC1455" /LENGTH=283 /DNA_ID=CAMNT_0007359039 /DNA_START=29 /DNA_END=880 /DNA_ORIENTATION=+
MCRVRPQPVQDCKQGVVAAFDAFSNKLPHPPNPVSAFFGSFAALGGLAFTEHILRLNFTEQALLFIGSFGALATLLFGAPAAPLGRPKNVLAGHFICIMCALVIYWCRVPILLAKVLIPALGISGMVYFKVQHPPAAACVIIFATTPLAKDQPGYGAFYLIAPALVGCLYFLLVQFCTGYVVRYFTVKVEPKSAAPKKQPSPKLVSFLEAHGQMLSNAMARAVSHAAESDTDDPLSHVIMRLRMEHARLYLEKSSVLRESSSASSSMVNLVPSARSSTKVQLL